MGNFIVRLNQRICDCGKPQKLHISCAHVIVTCKHINMDYLQQIHSVCTLDNLSSVYKVPLACIRYHVHNMKDYN